MVFIRKRKLGNKIFHYLVHNLKKNGKIVKKEKYLGKTIPKNIEELKKQFLEEIYKEKWHEKLNTIKKNYKSDFKKFPKSFKEKYIENFMIKFTYNTNRIEGSTLTLKETAMLLHHKTSPSNRPMQDIKESENHMKVFYKMLDHKRDLTRNTILDWHWTLLKDSKTNIAGKIRDIEIMVFGSKTIFPLPIELNALLRNFFKWYDRNKTKIHPVELSALAHLKFVSIHPFVDGNGRMSRLIMNSILNKNGFPMLDINYQNRKSYYNALERSQIKKQDHIFVQYIIKRYLKDYKKYINKKK
jgi:Fic family protein